MAFLRKLLAGIGAELRAIFGVLPLLRRPFWIAWGLCFLAALVGVIPGKGAVFAQLLVLAALGFAGLFSGTLAKRVRRRKWVEFPDGPEVVPYLPQLITLLAGPPYFLAMLVLWAVKSTRPRPVRHAPPPAGWHEPRRPHDGQASGHEFAAEASFNATKAEMAPGPTTRPTTSSAPPLAKNVSAQSDIKAEAVVRAR